MLTLNNRIFAVKEINRIEINRKTKSMIYTINLTIAKFLNKPSIQKEKLIRECKYTNYTPINMFRHGSVRDLLINNYLNT